MSPVSIISGKSVVTVAAYEKKPSICIGRHSSAPLNSVAIATFVRIVPQWPLSSPSALRSSWRNRRKQRILPAPPGEKGQNGEKGRYTNKRCAGWIIREKRPRNVNSHCTPSPFFLPLLDRHRTILCAPSGSKR